MDIITIIGTIIYLMLTGIVLYVLTGIVLYVCKVSNEYSNAQISKQNVDLVNKILDVHLENGAYDKDKLYNSLSKFYDEVIINEYQETPDSPICLSIQIIDYETKWYNNKQYITTDVILRKLDVANV